ncbi:MAG: hypothetical protein NT163_04400 [Chlorobiales bacterium]|nr:hypothetical protein [Chlorobiales bacterium]
MSSFSERGVLEPGLHPHLLLLPSAVVMLFAERLAKSHANGHSFHCKQFRARSG